MYVRLFKVNVMNIECEETKNFIVASTDVMSAMYTTIEDEYGFDTSDFIKTSPDSIESIKYIVSASDTETDVFCISSDVKDVKNETDETMFDNNLSPAIKAGYDKICHSFPDGFDGPIRKQVSDIIYKMITRIEPSKISIDDEDKTFTHVYLSYGTSEILFRIVNSKRFRKLFDIRFSSYNIPRMTTIEILDVRVVEGGKSYTTWRDNNYLNDHVLNTLLEILKENDIH
jgi:hypothetical protein